MHSVSPYNRHAMTIHTFFFVKEGCSGVSLLPSVLVVVWTAQGCAGREDNKGSWKICRSSQASCQWPKCGRPWHVFRPAQQTRVAHITRRWPAFQCGWSASCIWPTREENCNHLSFVEVGQKCSNTTLTLKLIDNLDHRCIGCLINKIHDMQRWGAVHLWCPQV